MAPQQHFGRGGWFVEDSNEPLGDARLAGEEDVLVLGKEAIECPELGPRGEGAADGGDGADGLLMASGGLMQRLAWAALRVGGLPVAAQDVLALAAAGQGDGIMILEGGPALRHDGVKRGYLCNTAE